MDPRDYLIAAGMRRRSSRGWMRRDGADLHAALPGKPVEVNALWVSGCGGLRRLLRRAGAWSCGRPVAMDLRHRARLWGLLRACTWDESLGCLFDRLEPAGSGEGGDGRGRRESRLGRRLGGATESTHRAGGVAPLPGARGVAGRRG